MSDHSNTFNAVTKFFHVSTFSASIFMVLVYSVEGAVTSNPGIGSFSAIFQSTQIPLSLAAPMFFFL